MEKGKTKASGIQGKEPRTKSKGDQATLGNYRNQNLPQVVSPYERENNQLLAHEDTSRRHEGRSFFGSDTFDDSFCKDPFFTCPFGEPFKSSGLFGSEGTFTPGIFELGQKLLNQFQSQDLPSVDRGAGGRNVQIEELSHNGVESGTRSSNQEPIIEHPDDDIGSFLGRQHFHPSQNGRTIQSEGSQANSYTFSSSSIMHGGSNGPLYASQTTRRQGPNGVIEEEHQEKNSTSGRAHHRVSHGLYDKGHSLIRERKKDGQEERFETLHNLAQEEVPQFENEWGRVAEKNLPKWPSSSSSQLGPSSSSRSRSRPALPSSGTSRKTTK